MMAKALTTSKRQAPRRKHTTRIPDIDQNLDSAAGILI